MTNSTPNFDSIKQISLAPLLGYNKWQNYEVAIRRATTAYEQMGQVVADRFTSIS